MRRWNPGVFSFFYIASIFLSNILALFKYDCSLKSPFPPSSMFWNMGLKLRTEPHQNYWQLRHGLDVTTSKKSLKKIIHFKTTMVAPQEVSIDAASISYIRTGEFISLKEWQKSSLKALIDVKEVGNFDR